MKKKWFLVIGIVALLLLFGVLYKWNNQPNPEEEVEPSTDFRPLEYTEVWLDKETVEQYPDKTTSDIVITEIYGNCFFGRPVIPSPMKYKINGTLGDEWCVGDQVFVRYGNTYYDDDSNRLEGDLYTIEESDFELEPGMNYKPVIYLYPEKEMEISVKLDLHGKLTCTYPNYGDGWKVLASPDGTLTDQSGQTYNYLYWEGETIADYDFSKGFCVKGKDTAEFLEEALDALGLNRKEANEFIVYWLPQMQENPYNIITFQTTAYTEAAKLNIAPTPDTVIRVFMAWQASEHEVKLPKQKLTAPERTGFTVIEWGGTEIKTAN